MAFLSAYEKLYDPWRELMDFYQVYQDAKVSYHQTVDYFDVAPEFQLEPFDRPPVDLQGSLEVKDLSFSVAGGIQLLKQINLSLNPGEQLALVGHSGSGKSTLAQCIAQLYPYTGGSVTLDGYEVATLSKQDLARNVGIVSQSPYIFDGTIKENLLVIDAVTIVTPNLWHTLAAIWAMQAGKHVTVEKPVSHNFFEGQKLVEAAAKYKVIVQDGLEQRSNPCAQTAVEYLRSGAMGEIYMAKGLCFKWRDTIGHHDDEPVPSGVHYDLWLGPAPSRPFNRNRFHYNWHWNWDYGCGDIGNQGVHELDVARRGLGVTLPTRISTSGAHFLFNDDQQTPNALMALFEFDAPAKSGDRKKILQFEVRGWITNAEDPFFMPRRAAASPQAPGIGAAGYMATDPGNVVGNLFFGSKGYMVKDVGEWRTYMGDKREPGPTGSGEANHYAAFVNAVRDGAPATINARMDEAFYSCTLVHLANISYRLGCSPEFDAETLTFPRGAEANRMLTREYRAPYVLPTCRRPPRPS